MASDTPGNARDPLILPQPTLQLSVQDIDLADVKDVNELAEMDGER